MPANLTKRLGFIVVGKRDAEDVALRELFDEIRFQYHKDELGSLKLALVWRVGQKQDPVGTPHFGSVRILSETDRQLSKVAVVITVNRYLWRRFTPERRNAWADSFLRRIRVQRSEAGKAKRYQDLGIRYRLELPPCGEFPEIVQRHGIWTEDLAELLGVSKARQLDLRLLDFVGDQDDEDQTTSVAAEPKAATG